MLWPSRDERIGRTADRWAAKSARGLSAEEIAERDRWRSADPAHERAWQRATALMSATEGMPRPREMRALDRTTRFQSRLAIASVIAIVAAGAGVLVYTGRPPMLAGSTPTEWATGQSGKEIRLADGTIVMLDPASVIRADLQGPIRSVLLERGTAQFDVARDVAHPFVVDAADQKVTAIGTRFAVALRPHGLVVTLFEGAVEVAEARRTAAVPVRMRHGQRLIIESGRSKLETDPMIDTVADAEVHDFDPTPVSAIVAQVNRFAKVPIRIADPSLGDRLVQGRFDIDDSDALAHQLGAALDVVVTRQGGTWLLSRP